MVSASSLTFEATAALSPLYCQVSLFMVIYKHVRLVLYKLFGRLIKQKC